nr:DUF3089 domain-containing protein [Novosphingobium flavum]
MTVVFFLGRVALNFWSGDLARMALVPDHGIEAAAPLPASAWADPRMWLARPGLAADPAQFRPEGMAPDPAPLPAAVFFVHPTSYFDRAHWNAPLDDPHAEVMSINMVRGMASAFNASPDVWVPRYRQATFGAFLTEGAARDAALERAYGDVRAAFAAFLAAVPADRPIVLAGHSQGALHLKRLLRDEVAGKPLARRIAAAYVIGWPVSIEHDLPQVGLPACQNAGQPGCVVSWQTYAEPADPGLTLEAYARTPALDGKLPGASPFLCTNPLTGAPHSAATGAANLGTLLPDPSLTGARLLPGLVPARCGGDGFLLIGPPPAMGPYVLPGNNYHIYDIPLFWANLRADVAARVAAWRPAP